MWGFSDSAGLGILAGLFLSIPTFAFILLVSYLACEVQRSKNSGTLSHQRAYPFFYVAAIFLLVNFLLFVCYIQVNSRLAVAWREALDGYVFLGWVPANILMYFVIASFLQAMRTRK